MTILGNNKGKGILEPIARRAMMERGFRFEFSEAALSEVAKIAQADGGTKFPLTNLSSLNSHRRWDRIVEIGIQHNFQLPPEPDSRALSSFLAVRKAADPLSFPDLFLSITKLLGPGEYVENRGSV